MLCLALDSSNHPASIMQLQGRPYCFKYVAFIRLVHLLPSKSCWVLKVADAIASAVVPCALQQLQTRSADEPMTTFVTCVACNNKWKCECMWCSLASFMAVDLGALCCAQASMLVQGVQAVLCLECRVVSGMIAL